MIMKGYYVVQAYEEGKKEYIDFLGFKQSRIHKFRHSKVPPNLIASNSVHGTWKMLQNLGFQSHQLPRCVGGTYDYSQFAEWTRMRLSIEDIMSSTPVLINNFSPATAKNKRRHLAHGDEKNSGHELARQRNALKTRRCYHRRELQLFVLQEQERAFHVRNRELRQENAFLDDLLLQARACVAFEEIPYID